MVPRSLGPDKWDDRTFSLDRKQVPEDRVNQDLARNRPVQWYSYAVRALIALLSALFFVLVATAQNTISFPTQDGGVVFADVYGTGNRAVVLAHGGPFDKESWKTQAERLV